MAEKQVESKLPCFIKHELPQQISSKRINPRMLFDAYEKLDQGKTQTEKLQVESK